MQTINRLRSDSKQVSSKGLHEISSFITIRGIETYEDFAQKAGKILLQTMELICRNLQEALKTAGDWKIYPFAVHGLIAQGRVQVAGRTVYVDDKKMPEYGYRIEEAAKLG